MGRRIHAFLQCNGPAGVQKLRFESNSSSFQVQKALKVSVPFERDDNRAILVRRKRASVRFSSSSEPSAREWGRCFFFIS